MDLLIALETIKELLSICYMTENCLILTYNNEDPGKKLIFLETTF